MPFAVSAYFSLDALRHQEFERLLATEPYVLQAQSWQELGLED